MNNGPNEGHKFVQELADKIKGQAITVDFAIAAPFITLPFMLAPMSEKDDIPFFLPLAAQNIHWEESGAYTGEISLKMIDQLGIEYAIIGHSERREYFNETDETVNKKIKAALKTDIIPVMAFGETEAQFEANQTKEVIKSQLTKGLKDIEAKKMSKVVLAYEPIWAIGTGKTATPKQAQEAIAYARSVIADLFGEEVAQQVIIQYGGSVKPENIKELMSMEDIDGALVGGASVSVESFAKLITYNL